MADIPRKLPKAVIQSGEDKFSWLHDIRTLSIGELIELYAYAEAIVETVREHWAVFLFRYQGSNIDPHGANVSDPLKEARLF